MYYNTFPQPTQIIKVNGEPGANAFQMAPNSNALLLDNTAPIVWLVQTDGAGYKSLTAYDITPHQPDPEVNLNDIIKRLDRLECMLNGKSDSSAIKQSDTAEQHTQFNEYT